MQEQDMKVASILRDMYDKAIDHAILKIYEYRDQILPEAFDELIQELKKLKG